MKTTEINGKEYLLTEGEGGKLTLTPLIKQPEPRTPEAGDVWITNIGSEFVVTQGMDIVMVQDGMMIEYGQGVLDLSHCTYLGKFSEVYVKIADVHSCIVSCNHQGSTVMNYESLRKIGIIK